MLYVLIGVSGSGKSSFVNDAAFDGRCGRKVFVVSTDCIRKTMHGDASIQANGREVFLRAYQSVHSWMKGGYSVIFDATSTTAKSRDKLLNVVADIPCKKVAVYFNTPLDECKKQNKQRERVVPDDVIDRQHKQLMEDAATIPEQFDEIVIVGGWKHEQ